MRRNAGKACILWSDQTHTHGKAFDPQGHCVDFRVSHDADGMTSAIYVGEIAFFWHDRAKSIDSDTDHE